MISVRLKNLNLKYQRFTPSGCKDIGIRKSEFVTKTQFLYQLNKEGMVVRFKRIIIRKKQVVKRILKTGTKHLSQTQIFLAPYICNSGIQAKYV